MKVQRLSYNTHVIYNCKHIYDKAASAGTTLVDTPPAYATYEITCGGVAGALAYPPPVIIRIELTEKLNLQKKRATALPIALRLTEPAKQSSTGNYHLINSGSRGLVDRINAFIKMRVEFFV